MKVFVAFSEIQELLKSKVGKEPQFCMLNSSTIKVRYTIEVKIPFFETIIKKEVSIQVTIVKIEGADIFLIYNGGLGIETMITNALRLFQSEPKLSFIETRENRQIILHLDQVEKIKSFFDKVGICSINIINDGFDLDCKLKDVL